MRTAFWLLLVGIFVLGGCERSAAPGAAEGGAQDAAPGTAASGAPDAHIEWFAGTVEQALAAAAIQHRPVFLYWGAEWCPPCHDLKAHVFSRRDFQDKMRQFIPVYLDGDAPGAQRSASEFQVSGYPTAVVLRADRTEITRIAGGMDLARYADVLDLALEDVRPVGQLLASMATGNARLTRADCRRLAYNGWLLAPDADAAPRELVASLQQAAQRCPAETGVERDRLIVTAAGLAAGSESASVEDGKPASPELAKAIADMAELLADPVRARRVADLLLDLGEDFFRASHRLRPDQDAVVLRNWFAAMDALELDQGYSVTIRLMSAAGRLYAAKAMSDDGQIPALVQKRARQTTDAFLARTYSTDERAGIVNSASWALTYLGDHARLRTLLEGEIRSSRTPYYYMPDLADLFEKEGDETTALSWLERGYRESRGPATRFQWGVLYLQGLLRMTPDDVARIQSATSLVLGELQGPDRIYGRARARLERLATELGKWSIQPERRAAAVAIAGRWQGICAALPRSDPARRDCPGMLPLAGA